MGVDPSVLVHVDRVLRGGIHSTGSKPFRGNSLPCDSCVYESLTHCVCYRQ